MRITTYARRKWRSIFYQSLWNQRLLTAIRLAALKEKIAQHQEHLKELDQQVYVYLIVFNHSRSPKWLTFSLVRTEWARVRKRGQISDSERDDQTETFSESGDDSLERSIF